MSIKENDLVYEVDIAGVLYGPFIAKSENIAYLNRFYNTIYFTDKELAIKESERLAQKYWAWICN